MDKTLYKLKDGYNSDIVAESDNIEEIKDAAAEYNEGCEGDWLPCLYKQDETGRYVLVEDFIF